MDEFAQLDQYWWDQGVRFLPWVGDRYEQGFNGRRLLILGESHYPWEDEYRELLDPLPPEVTRNCVQDVVEREHWVGDFWKYLEQAHLNAERWEMAERGDEFWHSIAFYNFVQVPVGKGPREAPNWAAFVEARPAFRTVIGSLNPERIIVCGKRLWAAMEDASDYLHDDVQGYRLAGGEIAWCLATVHPSSGRYSWRRLHPLITAFIADPTQAEGLLRAQCSSRMSAASAPMMTTV